MAITAHGVAANPVPYPREEVQMKRHLIPLLTTMALSTARAANCPRSGDERRLDCREQMTLPICKLQASKAETIMAAAVAEIARKISPCGDLKIDVENISLGLNGGGAIGVVQYHYVNSKGEIYQENGAVRVDSNWIFMDNWQKPFHLLGIFGPIRIF